MKRWLDLTAILTIGLILVLSVMTLATPSRAQGDAPGKTLFLGQKCNMCHAVPAAGVEATTTSDKMKGPDIANLADKYDAEWVTKYVTKMADKDGKPHVKAFKGTDEELQSLVDWLLEQQ